MQNRQLVSKGDIIHMIESILHIRANKREQNSCVIWKIHLSFRGWTGMERPYTFCKYGNQEQ